MSYRRGVAAAVAEVAVAVALGAGTPGLTAMVLIGLGGLGVLAVRRRRATGRPDDAPTRRGWPCQRRPAPTRPVRIAPWCMPASPEWRPRACPQR